MYVCMYWQLDGERICAHVGRRASSSSSSREVMLVTRSGTDYTDNYRQLAESVERGVLAGHEAILDGEVLAWDSIERRHVPFGNNSMVAKKERERAAAAAGAGAGEMGPPLTSWMKVGTVTALKQTIQYNTIREERSNGI